MRLLDVSIAAGARLGPYEIVAPLGAGGVGEVYRARYASRSHRRDQGAAAGACRRSAAARALRARGARRLLAPHPHICALFDVGRAGDQDYLVLEYLEGETLADRIARAGALPPAEALKIGAEVCDALDKAHRSGIVHRDLKPANVMLTKAGAKLLDVGLAKRAAPVVASSGFSMLPTTPPNVTAQGTMARFRTWRRSRLRGSRPTRAPISLHSACCSRCHGADGVRRQDAREPAGRDPERRAAAHL